jgi:hypothetical protein
MRPFMLPDFLHLVKNVRTRMIKYLPVLFYQQKRIVVRVESIKPVLKVGAALDDMSSTGKMQDAYPIAIFRLEHVLTLFEQQLFGESVYLLPWALVFRTLFSTQLSKRTRAFTLEVALLILSYFEKSYQSERTRTLGPFTIPLDLPPYPNLNQQGPAESEVGPCQEMTVIRGMSSVAALMGALGEFAFDFPWTD